MYVSCTPAIRKLERVTQICVEGKMCDSLFKSNLHTSCSKTGANLVKERDLIKESLEMWRQNDADNIVRRLEKHQEEDAESEFENDKSFSDALKRLTVEAQRQRLRFTKETHEIEKSKRYDAYEGHVRGGQSSFGKRHSRRKHKTKKRVFYFNDKNLNDAFFS